MTAALDTGCVLVVDDNDDSRTLIGTHLTRLGHTVCQAGSAFEAFETLQRTGFEQFSAIATDYWMPGGTGLDLLRKVRPLDPTLAFLIITADTEKAIVADTLRHGGCDCLEKPVSGSRLQESIARAISQTQQQRRQRAAVQSARALGRSQLQLLERHTTALGDRIRLHFHSQAEASGDFISVFPLDDGRLALFASDAAGHDLPAAFLSTYFHGLARGMMLQGADVDDVLAFFNGLLLWDWNTQRVDYSLAAFGGLLDFEARTLAAFNCGFPTPFLSDQAGWATPLESGAASSPLGWFEDLPEVTHHTIVPGHLHLWSDGLPALAEHLDVDPLCLAHRLLSGRRSPADDALLARAQDDIATIRIRLGATPDPAPPLPLFFGRYDGGDAARIDELDARFERSLRLALPDFPEDRLVDVLVAAHEALLNALRHGCGGDPARHATWQAAVAADGRRVLVRVTDDGPGHDFDVAAHEAAAAAELRSHHRGLILIKHLATRLTLDARGAVVVMEFDAST